MMYSFVAMGIAAVCEWDLFFPDLLDVMVLGTLPVAAASNIPGARGRAIAAFILGFLLDANVVAPVVLAMATDPPDPGRFAGGRCACRVSQRAVRRGMHPWLQGVVLSIAGERLFCGMSLAVQGFVVTALVMPMLLFPVLSSVTPGLLAIG